MEFKKCEGCGERTDPDTCWCGDSHEDHGAYSGHGFVPMGCGCMREDAPVSLKWVTDLFGRWRILRNPSGFLLGEKLSLSLSRGVAGLVMVTPHIYQQLTGKKAEHEKTFLISAPIGTRYIHGHWEHELPGIRDELIPCACGICFVAAAEHLDDGREMLDDEELAVSQDEIRRWGYRWHLELLGGDAIPIPPMPEYKAAPPTVSEKTPAPDP